MGNAKIAGAGSKKPQLNIPIEIIDLDSENPRLAKEYQGSSQIALLNILYEEFNLDELAYSMSENGYFDEEPIVVVPKSLPKGFKYDDFKTSQSLQEALEGLIAEKKITFIVVEGNRRIATAKILCNEDLRKKLKLDEDFPKPKNKTVEDDLKIIPGIFYNDRALVSPYLGVRHIAGILKWEAYAKAVYLALRIEEENKKIKDIEKSIKEVQKQTADRSDSIKKQYMCYKVVEQAESDLGFDTDEIKRRFSLVTVALNSGSIRDYVGVASYKEVNFDKPLVPKKKLENLGYLLTWIFGDGKGIDPILTDSRRISSTLSHVLADSSATDYLLKYNNLQEAYERSGGEKEFLKKKISAATKNIQNALNVAYKYRGDNEIIDLAAECNTASDELINVLSKK